MLASNQYAYRLKAVMAIFVQPAASRIYEKKNARILFGPNFHRLGWGAFSILFVLEQHHFTIPAALKAITSSKFTQSFIFMKIYLDPNVEIYFLPIPCSQLQSETSHTGALLSVLIVHSLAGV